MLPKMDVPINLLEWEVFLPEQYKVKDFGGDAIAANLLPATSLDVSGAEGALNGMARGYSFDMLSLLPGQLGGIVVDPTGAMVPNAQVTVTQIDTGAQRTVVTDNSGRWIVSNLSTGRVKIAVNALGFKQLVSQINYDGGGPVPFNFALSLGAASELVEVIAANGPLALTATKRIMAESADWPDSEFFARQGEVVAPVMSSEDAREGATAFAEKREPVWHGR